MTWSITLPIDLPSANERIVNGRHRGTAAIYRRSRNGYAATLKMEAYRLGIPSCNRPTPILDKMMTLVGRPPPPAPFRHVHLVRLLGKGQRKWDSDNLPAAFKGFRDAMQRERVVERKGKVPTLVPGAGIVWDDSDRWSAFTYAQIKSDDGRPGVRSIITDGATP